MRGKKDSKAFILFRKMFELRGDTVFASKCGDLNLKRKTKEKYEKIWNYIVEQI